MSKLSLKKKVAAGAAVAATLVGTTAAYAWWTTDASGSQAGGATAASNYSSNLVITEGTAPTGFVPGGDAQAIPLTVTNNNPGSATVGSIAVTVDAVGSCAADNWLTTPASVAAPIAGGGGTAAATGATIKLVNKPDASQDACKGVSPTLHFGFTQP